MFDEKESAPHLNRHPIYSNITFREGTKPFNIIDPDPSPSACLKSFGSYECGLIALTTALPSYVAYRGTSTLISFCNNLQIRIY